MTTHKLFDQCSFAFVIGSSLSDAHAANLRKLIQENGGQILEPADDGSLRLKEATHIIANTIDFPEYMRSQEKMVPVVTDSWVSRSITRNRILPLRNFSPDPRMFFNSVVVTPGDDIPSLDAEIIFGAVYALGGVGSRTLTRQTTHLCTLSLDDPKCKEVELKALKNVKIVLPHYFDDCFKLGKRISEAPYLLPDPPILRRNVDDPPIPANSNMVGATSACPDFMVQPTEKSNRQPLLVFQGKKVYFADDLGLQMRLKKILTSLISNGQGKVVEDDRECDWYIGQYRSGDRYIRAAKAGKEIGNLSWLYHLITFNNYTSPMQRLLHYPLPKDGIPGFKDLKITVSNYGGEARIYLENLIKACGATYTKTMNEQNTHLITARDGSDKCAAARDWNINMVNHLWIEESYARCCMQALTLDKYTYFPPQTNLGEVVGQTFFIKDDIEQNFYPGEQSEQENKGKRKRQAVDRTKQVGRERCSAIDVIVPHQDQDADVLRNGPEPEADQSDATPARRKNNHTKTPARQIALRVDRSGKENDGSSVMSSGSRSAKADATAKIHNLSSDMLLYEKEKKRSGKGVPFGGKRAADEVEQQLAATRKSSPVHKNGNDEVDRGEDEDIDDDTKRPVKRTKTSLPPIEYRLVVTGWTHWVDNLKLEDAEMRKLRALGIAIVKDYKRQSCDYLVAPCMVRTVKFLVTLARGVPVISTSFLEKCLETDKLQDIELFRLVDVANETKFQVKLSETVARAKAHKGKLLHGVPIYCTEAVPHGTSNYQDIAMANGAIFKIYRARSGTTIKRTTAEEDGGAPPEPVYLITGVTPAERSLWPKFRRMAEDGHMKPVIVLSDWLLDVAMRQQVFFDDRYLADDSATSA